jgi:MoaA/NifB/PqqE/SkfB family radical SAM enzyme
VITRKCELRCKHWYSDSNDTQAPDELSTVEAKGVLDDLAEWGIRLLIFDGGEPLCRDDFFEIAEYAAEKGMRTVVGSNGVLIDVEMADRMKNCGIQMVQMAVDGAKPETHDSFRGVEGAFQKTMQRVEACEKAGLSFQFGMGIRKQCLPEIPDVLRLAVESGANAVEFFDLISHEQRPICTLLPKTSSERNFKGAEGRV